MDQNALHATSLPNEFLSPEQNQSNEDSPKEINFRKKILAGLFVLAILLFMIIVGNFTFLSFFGQKKQPKSHIPPTVGTRAAPVATLFPTPVPAETAAQKKGLADILQPKITMPCPIALDLCRKASIVTVKSTVLDTEVYNLTFLLPAGTPITAILDGGIHEYKPEEVENKSVVTANRTYITVSNQDLTVNYIFQGNPTENAKKSRVSKGETIAETRDKNNSSSNDLDLTFNVLNRNSGKFYQLNVVDDGKTIELR